MASRTKMLLLVMLLTLLVSIMPVSAANGAVGVKAGDWAKYGEISVNWVSFSSEPTPQFAVDLNDIEWIKIEVQNVSDTKVTAMETKHFKDETERIETRVWNIVNLRWGCIPAINVFVIQANLSEGDLTHVKPYGSYIQTANGTIDVSPILKVTDTVSRKYAGATREINHINASAHGKGGWGLGVDAYWDKTTGILCELREITGSALSGSRTTTMKIIETNLWQPTPIYVEPSFWIALVVIVAAVAVPAIWVWRRRKVALHKEEAVSAPTL
jgi:hypothetical protein